MRLKPHPLYIWYDARKWFWLLLIPVLRAVLTPWNAAPILAASLRDVGLALLLIGLSVARWRQAAYRLDEEITLDTGLWIRRSLHLAVDDAASVEVERSPLMWLTRSRRVRVSTAGLRRRADATLYLPASTVRTLMEESPLQKRRRYAARLWPVTMLAASGSNAAVGLLTLAPAVRQISHVLGQQVPDQVYNLMDRILSLGLPPLLNSLANLLVLSWGVSFIGSWLRHSGFTARREGDRLWLASGLITRRNVWIDSRKITALELRQTLFMRMFRLYTATITAAGYGREKGARPIVVPAARSKELCAALDELLPEYPICPSCLRPGWRSVFRFIGLPLVPFVCGWILLCWGGLWSSAGLLLLIGGGWWLIIRGMGFRWAGFGVGSGAVTMRYSRGLALYAVHVPVEVADCAILTRSPFQKRSGTCTVELRCFGEKRRRHRVPALPYWAAQALVDRLRRENPHF